MRFGILTTLNASILSLVSKKEHNDFRRVQICLEKNQLTFRKSILLEIDRSPKSFKFKWNRLMYLKHLSASTICKLKTTRLNRSQYYNRIQWNRNNNARAKSKRKTEKKRNNASNSETTQTTTNRRNAVCRRLGDNMRMYAIDTVDTATITVVSLSFPLYFSTIPLTHFIL